MRAVIFLLIVYSSALSIVSAQTTSTLGTITDTNTASSKKKWGNRIEIECRGPRETAANYMARVNRKLLDHGQGGMELISVGSGPDLGYAQGGAQDCLVIAYKWPIPMP